MRCPSWTEVGRVWVVGLDPLAAEDCERKLMVRVPFRGRWVMRLRSIGVAVSLSILALGCGSDDDSAGEEQSTTVSTSTTSAPVEPADGDRTDTERVDGPPAPDPAMLPEDVVALFATGADWDVEDAGREAARYWVTFETFCGGEDMARDEIFSSAVWGDESSTWVDFLEPRYRRSVGGRTPSPGSAYSSLGKRPRPGPDRHRCARSGARDCSLCCGVGDPRPSWSR